MKVTIITCYDDPDYVRAKVLRTCLAADKLVELTIIKNKRRNLLRYPEVLAKLFWQRLTNSPDAYVVTFRGYEILPFVQLLAGKRPVVFDEFINAVEFFVYEHHIFKPRGELARWFAAYYRWLLKRCTFILADTPVHGAYSAALSGVSHSLYRPIPVGTDESVFKPLDRPHKKAEGKFEVFYYGKDMRPLHGLNYVLEAAEQLGSEADISFVLVGGNKLTEQAIDVAKANGAHITYKPWIPFHELPKAMSRASLCLGGPFGDTEQSKLIITGKTYQMLALGMPTVVGRSHASGAFTDKKDCLLVSQGDGTVLANAIRWAYEHQASLPKIGANGRKLYEKRFSNQVIQQKLSKLTNELAKL